MPVVQSGEIITINELNAKPSSYNTRTVRITGRLREHDIHKNVVVLSAERERVEVDVLILGDFGWRINSLYQVIGEVELRSAKPFLKARVCRCVDGLDMKLYEQALELRRAFLEGHYSKTSAKRKRDD
eukprot:Colp12_sorted_trinity150504_noHs@1116